MTDETRDQAGRPDGGSAEIACPICSEPVGEDAPQAPFCSSRCRLIDLGKWLSGDYMISRDLTQRDLEEGVD